MQIRGNLPNSIDDNIFGKEGIHLMGQRFRILKRVFKVEMSVIVARMDARVGATTTSYGDRPAQL